jgi:hypothetical protein
MPGTTSPAKLHKPENKTIFYIEECIVFLITIVAVIFSDLIERYTNGHMRQWEFVFSWYKIVAASFIAIMVHGTMNSSFKYSDKGRPPFFKRAYQAVLNGVAWKSLIGLTGLN